ncbi:hypothetical protein NDN08_000702 [Rhodosorus marinus]|uniref:Glucose/Sorbosone dehydrogenase domain-containing protein n=1 Tax=Rhodosorus marinus TaxID=101924 RepID=A0AAV8UNQ2_9RHOD|nr:hypothetical protein NDN08_000702 [Rhodosorus marinus]
MARKMMRVGRSAALVFLVGCLLVGLAEGKPIVQTIDSSFQTYNGNTILQDCSNCTDTLTIKLVNWDVIHRNSPCGLAARLKLEQLLPAIGDLEIEWDTEENMFVAKSSDSLKAIAKIMIGRNLAGADETADSELVDMHFNKRREFEAGMENCYFKNLVKLEYYGGGGDEVKHIRSFSRLSTGPRLDVSSRVNFLSEGNWPTGFEEERFSKDVMFRPVDFLFEPNDNVLVGLNEGRILRLSKQGRIIQKDVVDVRDETNDYHDRGIMSIAIANDYKQKPYLYFFHVYDHTKRAADYQKARTGRVVRTMIINGKREDKKSREIVIGKEEGFGCKQALKANKNADCLSVNDKSHVGGGLAFDEDNNLVVTVGDGEFASVVPSAINAQRLTSLSGKILRISTKRATLGEGLKNNPYFDGNGKHIRSKIYATGVRNPLHIHPSTTNKNRFYIGDVQWSSMEEIDVVTAGANFGWPCFEGTLPLKFWAKTDECKKLIANKKHKEPLIEYPHFEGKSYAVMIGERISIKGWPNRYYDVLTYADNAHRFIGFAKLNNQDVLVEDLDRVYVSAAPVQVRAGPDNSLYFISVYGIGELTKVTYTRDKTPVKVNLTPDPGTQIKTRNSVFNGKFTKSVEPDSATRQNVFLRNAKGVRIAADYKFDYGRRSFELTVTKALTAGEKVSLVVKSGRAGVVDLDGGVLNKDLIYTYTVSATVDKKDPTVVSTRPKHKEEDVDPSDDIRVRFSEALDASTVSGSYTISKKGAGEVNGGEAEYDASARAITIKGANLDFRTTYIVAFKAKNGVKDLAGNSLSENFQFSFRTGKNPSSIDASITKPSKTLKVEVGDSIPFAGVAIDTRNGNNIPREAFGWQLLIHHCSYTTPPSCHTHSAGQAEGTRSGTFKAATHEDNFFYEVLMVVTWRGETVQVSQFVETKKVRFNFESQPAGVPLSLTGYTVNAPFSELVVLGSDAQVFAPETYGPNNQWKFVRWAGGGPRIQNIKILKATTYRAIYAKETSGGTPTIGPAPPTPNPTGGNIVVTNPRKFLRLSGGIPVSVTFTAPAPAEISLSIQVATESGAIVNQRFNVPQGSGKRDLTLRGYGQLKEGETYRVRVDLRPRGAEFSDRYAGTIYIALASSRPGIPSRSSVRFVRKAHSDRISADGPYYVKTSWAASEPSDIFLTIQSTKEKNRIAVAKKEVGRGYGVEDIGPLDFSGLTPQRGPYNVQLAIRPRGTMASQNKATVINKVNVQQHDHVTILGSSTIIPKQGPLKVEVAWVALVVAAQGRDLFVELHTLGKNSVIRKKISVKPGPGQATINLNYNNLDPSLVYELRAVLKTKTGLFEDRDLRLMIVEQ